MSSSEPVVGLVVPVTGATVNRTTQETRMPAQQNPMDQIVAARAALDRRSVALFWIPNDERAQVVQSDGELFDDIAAVGLIALTHAEQNAVMRRMGDKSAIDVATALLADALRAVVLGGPIYGEPDSPDSPPPYANELENPTKPTMISGSTDALRYVTRMHPITRERALLAYAEIHTAREANNKRFLASKTYIAT